ncbi:MaoC/PaaZ C-terminal domain-containing protein [Brevibacillus fulvus]|uniref:Acyl dehydratase n=1 Tax=Brevibacillus fulvus TaxID=1125967 RepID=A0A939BT85_9BACL|nr:MaoC/PaaZ C-terminal domain-containing protein [Brevibacillus fulvus]MBM7589219.1 acyl dehydratase [Brevibacillus fulvus]
MQSFTWNELEVGMELEPLVQPAIEKVQLVKYAGASGDFNPIHTDDETAKKVGLPSVIAHGMLSMGFLAKHAGQIVGTYGFVSRLKVRFSGMVFPGDVLACHAKVTGKDEASRTVDLEVFISRDEGKPLTIGEATLTYY